MDIRNNTDRYGVIAKLFHWVVALLIIGLLVAGFSLSFIDDKALRSQVIFLHKSFGLLLIMMVVLRLLWRWLNPPPTFPASMPKWRATAAHSSHYTLYGLMVLMPLSGIIMSTLYGYPPSLFGLFSLPQFISVNKNLAQTFGTVHLILAWSIIAVVSVHIFAALEHHFSRKDGILKRML